MNVAIIVGTRPQIIKSQPIVEELISKNHQISIIHTGQHYDYKMSKTFFEELKIKKPDINLNINLGSTVNQLGSIIQKLENPLKKISPDCVLIPGDTRSALGASLSASRIGFPVVHIESGARSNDFSLEEEINRRMIDNCSKILFAPTKNCLKNLKTENILGSSFFTGDTMYDIFLKYSKKLKFSHENKSILMTIHRQQNIQDISKIKKIIHLAILLSSNGYQVIFPIHPHTKKQITSHGISLEKLNIVEPMNYSKILKILSESKLVITDSGGLQKESFWTNTPCVTLRNSTEWIETLESNKNILVKNITTKTFSHIKKILSLPIDNSTNKKFGDGKASEKMISILGKNI